MVLHQDRTETGQLRGPCMVSGSRVSPPPPPSQHTHTHTHTHTQPVHVTLAYLYRYDASSKYAFVADYSGQVNVLKLDTAGFQLITTLKGHQSECVRVWECEGVRVRGNPTTFTFFSLLYALPPPHPPPQAVFVLCATTMKEESCSLAGLIRS